MIRMLMMGCLALLAAWAQADTRTTQLARTSILSQVVGLDGTITVTGRAGEISVAGQTLNTSLMGQKMPNAASAFSLAPLSLPSASLSTEEIEKLATPWMQSRLPTVSAQLVNHLTSTGHESAWLDYQQAVRSKGKTKYIVFSLSVKRDGNPTWSGVNVVDSAPTTVFITYTSQAVQLGLPAAWTYPNAGALQYDVRNMNFVPVTAPTVIATAGAYDAPQSMNPSDVVDPDAGLKCLIDQNSAPTCSKAYLDARALIRSTDSVRAVVDYVRRVQPEYQEQPDGSQQASMALDVYQRVIKLPACCCQDAGQTYSNRQRYGYKLQTTVDRYMVNPDGSYTLVNRFNGFSVSPTIDQHKSVQITSQQIPALSSQIINPVEGMLDLLDVSSFPPGQIVNLAPIVYQ
ncbi:hypothetical protein [Chromobacterium amazonense]|uniref:hypothetical protein n=1 Tax=Chromobacterium amazonense TaxID=1382803 RepID=UPI003F79396C